MPDINSDDALSFVDAISSGNSLIKIVEHTKLINIKLKYGRELPALPEALSAKIKTEGYPIGETYYKKFRAILSRMRDHLENHSLGFLSRKGNGAWKLYADLTDMEGYILTPAAQEIYLQLYKDKKAEYDTELDKFIDEYPEIIKNEAATITDSYLRNVLERWATDGIRGVRKIATSDVEVATNKAMESMQSSTIHVTKQYEIETYVDGSPSLTYEVFTLATEELRDQFDETAEIIQRELINTLPRQENLKQEYTVMLEVGTLPNFKQLEKDLEARKNAGINGQPMNETAKSVLSELGKNAQPMLDAYSMKKKALNQVNQEFAALFKVEIALKLKKFIAKVEDGDTKMTKSAFNALLGKKTSKTKNTKIGLLDKLEGLGIPEVNDSIAELKTKMQALQSEFNDSKDIDKSIMDDLKSIADGIEEVGEPTTSPDAIGLNDILPPPSGFDDEDDDML